MLIGQFEGTVSAKNQISFPKNFRRVLGEKLIITKGLEEYLIVVSQKNWKTLLEGSENRPFTNQEARLTQRYLLGNASFVTVDTRGRFIISEHLRSHAKIKQNIIFAGIERFVEIWDKESWEKHQEELEKTVSGIAGKLDKGDIK